MSVHPQHEQNPQSVNYVAKLLMLGQSCVGKTSIVKRCAQNIFPQNNTLLTVGVDIRKIVKKIKTKTICLELWDTAGQQKFKTLPPMYFKNVQGIILVYDLSDAESFQQLQNWFGKIDQNCNLQKLALILVGNKKDLQANRQVPVLQGLKFAQHKKMKFIQTSAKLGQNVEQMINQIMAIVIEKELLISRAVKRQVLINENQRRSSNKRNDACC